MKNIKTYKIIEFFIPLFEDLHSGKNDMFQNINIKSAPAFGNAKMLYLHETEGKYPSLSSLNYSIWQITKDGIEKANDCPYPEGFFTHDEFIRIPSVKLSHNNAEILFALDLGPNWYAQALATFNKKGIRSCDIIRST